MQVVPWILNTAMWNLVQVIGILIIGILNPCPNEIFGIMNFHLVFWYPLFGILIPPLVFWYPHWYFEPSVGILIPPFGILIIGILIFGILNSCHWTPPHCQTGTLWHLFSGKIMQMPVCTKTFLLKIGPTNHPGKGLDPPPQTGNAQMNRYKN